MSDAISLAAEVNAALFARRIPHGNFRDALERGKALVGLPELGMPGSGMMVHGPSGVGKTVLTHALVEYGQNHYGQDAVIRTQLTNGATIKGVVSSLLYAFGDPRAAYGTEQALTYRLKQTVTERRCRLIVIDEAQHLLPGGKPSRRTIDNILNALKILDETRVSFLLAGMDEINQLWVADPQIRSRFQVTYYLDVLVYPRDWPAWRGIVKKYAETLEQYGMWVDCPDFERRCYAATRGALRPLVLILASAVSRACKAGQTRLTPEHLRLAAELQVDKRDGLPNAFDLELQEIERFNRELQTERRLAPAPRRLGDVIST